MEIRLLEPADGEAYGNLRRESLEAAPLAFGSSAEEHRALSSEAVAARLQATSDAGTFGAFEDGRLVGTVSLSRAARPKQRHLGSVAGMFVSPESRGQGAGRALMAALLDRARTLDGLERLNLGVSTVAPEARALYRSLGFVTYGVEPQAIRYEGRDADVELMTLALHDGNHPVT